MLPCRCFLRVPESVFYFLFILLHSLCARGWARCQRRHKGERHSPCLKNIHRWTRHLHKGQKLRGNKVQHKNSHLGVNLGPATFQLCDFGQSHSNLSELQFPYLQSQDDWILMRSKEQAGVKWVAYHQVNSRCSIIELTAKSKCLQRNTSECYRASEVESILGKTSWMWHVK